ncbi:OLC1v1016333C2 [Oldenlandia corymbosa var. corymbosa]|uniref:OLC1v1016333C2 n=1 Tax=Oldenlandia corymbosa var. corymbosa TaxID=529605 RepID=A0AAV1E588_OLDCO|nr:OLC1v1016333C2 [Oldenlandia corymbosa var. corymbosa]
MPASSSEARRWKKRRREPQISRKLKAPQSAQDDDGLEDDDEDDEELIEDENVGNGQNPSNFSMERTVQVRESEAVSEDGERVSSFPIVVKRSVYRPHSSVLSVVAMEKAGNMGESRGPGQSGIFLENISHGQLQALSSVPADSSALAEESGSGSGSYVISPPQIMKGKGVIKKFGSAERVHVVPCHADWFSPDSVHRLERQVVPHFFSGKSADHTPEKYIECRNCIVAKYMENPEKALSLTDCRGFIASISIDDITRILRFLDHWGIINYCAASSSRDNQKDETYLREDPNGDLNVPVAALKTIDSLVQFDKPKCRLKASEIYPDLECQQDEDTDFDSKIREYLSETRCNYCSRPTPTVYYQSQKEVDVLLCIDCFHDGRFVAGHSSLDFVKVNSLEGYAGLDGESWTDQETLLLLEGMQLYNENWNEVAEHVGTKSKAQCILHFVRLPVDGIPLDNIEVPSFKNMSSLQNGEKCVPLHARSRAACDSQDPDSESKFPFANCGNPVMALVAFLASAVGPRVAAACAHASLASLSKDDTSVTPRNSLQMDGSMMGMEGGSHGKHVNSGQQKDATELSAEKVRTAAKDGLFAAATKAKLFADHEEREIQRLSANIVNHQLKRLELKLKQFAEVETLLMRECEQMERTRQRIASERALMGSSQVGSPGLARPLGPQNVSPTMIHGNFGNNRQQVIPNAPQPFISGFSSNQAMHPHMSLISPQQSMYGLGPRLPLSAINPSSSTPPNMIFNSPANPHAALNHAMLRPLSGSKSGLG